MAFRKPSYVALLLVCHAAPHGHSSGCGVSRLCSELGPGEWLAPGEWLSSPSQNFAAVICAGQLQIHSPTQTEPSLVLPPVGAAVDRDLTAVARLIDGELVLESVGRQRLWSFAMQAQALAVLRFTVTATRGGSSGMWGGVQISEFNVWSQGHQLNLGRVRASSPNKDSPSYQNPGMAIDGDVETKWWVSTEPNVTLVLELPAIPPAGVDEFSFITGDDMPSRDPVGWLLEGSRDGYTWVQLHYQMHHATPSARLTTTEQFDITDGWRLLQSGWSGRTRPMSSSLSLTDAGDLVIVSHGGTQRHESIPYTSPSLAAAC